MRLDEGYIYSVYSNNSKPNEEFKKFLISLKSLKENCGDVNVAIYTNIKIKNIKGVNQIIYDKNMPKHHIAKAYGILKSPFFKNIFLDNDTIINRNLISEIFDILDEFELAGCHSNCWGRGEISPDINTGLLGCKKNKKGIELIKYWILLSNTQEDWLNIKRGPIKEKRLLKDHTEYDQPSFRKMWMENKKNLYVLPSYFQGRQHHFQDFFKNVVIYHDKCMNKKQTQEYIIKTITNSK